MCVCVWGGAPLTVSQASRHAGRGEGVPLLGVHQLADGRQLVDLAMGGGAGAVGGLGGRRRPGGGDGWGQGRLETGDISADAVGEIGVSVDSNMAVFVVKRHAKDSIHAQKKPFYSVTKEADKQKHDSWTRFENLFPTEQSANNTSADCPAVTLQNMTSIINTPPPQKKIKKA